MDASNCVLGTFAGTRTTEWIDVTGMSTIFIECLGANRSAWQTKTGEVCQGMVPLEPNDTPISEEISLPIGTEFVRFYLSNGVGDPLVTIKEIYQEDKLYINGLLQPETPSLPDPTQTLLYNEVATIGYPDDITLHHAPIEGWTTIKTEQEILDAYNA